MKLQSGGLQKRDSGTGFTLEFCEIFKNAYFVRYLQKAAFVYYQANINQENVCLYPILFIYLIIGLGQK